MLMVTAVLHNFVATRQSQRSTGSEYSWQVDQRGPHSGFTCRQVGYMFCFLYLPSYLSVVSATSWRAGQVRFSWQHLSGLSVPL